jgi:ParB-like chromosome segregation protein Spo0J
MAQTQWKSESFDPKKLQLDPQNPRIEVEKGVTQEQLRLKLLELEDVLDLARGIERNKGLFYGERIIVVEEAGKGVVLEGNRRVAACQMLLSPALVPANFKTRFPVASAETKTAIRAVMADVSPSRAVAEPILTKRHTEQGAKPWSPVAKMRRAVRLLNEHSVEGVAQLLGTSTTQVRKLIRPYRLLKLALGLDVWTPDERRVLEDEKLKTNPYTRLFTLAATKEALRAHFDEDQNIVSGLTPAKFKSELERIARDFLIPDPANGGKPRCDTRTDETEYFAALLAENKAQGWTPGGAQGSATGGAAGGRVGGKPSATPATTAKPATKPQGTAQGTATQPQTPKASVFFENLQCHVQDDILIKLSGELKTVNHLKMPVAASLLLRATFECALVYRIRKAKKWGDVMAKQKQGSKPGRDPGLSDLITFAAVHANGVFVEQNMCKTLGSGTTKTAKNYLDAMTHMKFQEADPQTLVSVANNIRAIIQYILNGN